MIGQVSPPEPDPRIERSRRRVLAATLVELGETGYGAFAVEAVAARSGVAKSTIYRHWRDKLALIADAFETLHAEEGPDIATGSAREKVERVISHVASLAADSTLSACFPALIEGAARDPRVRAFLHRFQAEARRPLETIIAEGVRQGELPSWLDPQLTAQSLIGAIFYLRLMSPMPFPAKRARDLVVSLLGPPGGSFARRAVATRKRRSPP